MPAVRATAAVGLLDACLAWTTDVVQAARVAPGSTPTPCEEWDLERLLAHLCDSLAALDEAARLSRVSTVPPPVDHAAAPPVPVLVDRLSRRAHSARATWSTSAPAGSVAIEDLSLPHPTVALVLALEVAVHGWDVARSLGDAVLPADLAVALLPVARAVVQPGERADRFAEALPPGPGAAGRLLAHVGRDAAWTPPRSSYRPAAVGERDAHPSPW